MDAVEESVSKVLSDFGLSSVEISVYQAALSLGSRPASTIAQKANLKRGHTYNVLQTLMEKGIVQEFVRGGVRHFTCSPPKSLLSIIHQREHELKEQKENLLKVIPQLEQLRNPLSAEPRVRFFKGLDGIKEIFEDMIRCPNQTIYGLVDLQYSWSIVDSKTQNWTRNFIRRREQNNIRWYGIAVRSDLSDYSVKLRPSYMRKMKVLDGVSFPAELHIYGEKVAITSTYRETIGVLIENEPIAETLRTMHQLLWKTLPDYPESDTSGDDLDDAAAA